jgi:hypothetical protein
VGAKGSGAWLKTEAFALASARFRLAFQAAATATNSKRRARHEEKLEAARAEITALKSRS